MTRGRHPIRAIDNAKDIAEKRGLVRYYARTPGRLCDFSIVTPYGLAEVRIKPMRHLRSTPEWLEREASGDIAALKMYPSSQQISRELWISSPQYFRRYFRVTDTGLIELSPDGQPLPADSPKTGPARRRRPGLHSRCPGISGLSRFSGITGTGILRCNISGSGFSRAGFSGFSGFRSIAGSGLPRGDIARSSSSGQGHPLQWIGADLTPSGSPSGFSVGENVRFHLFLLV